MAGEHRRSMRGPVHPSFDFEAIAAAKFPRGCDIEDEVAIEARCSVADPVKAAKLKPVDGDQPAAPTADPAEKSSGGDIAARLAAAEQRLKRAVVRLAGD